MRVVMLDFDGVLVCADYLQQKGLDTEDVVKKRFNPEAIARLNGITEETGASLVLSTNWTWAFGSERLAEILDDVGVAADVLGPTVRKMSIYRRVDEITMWLDRYRERTGENVESFVILEDEHPMHKFEHRTVRTRWEDGLLDAHVRQAIDILETPWDGSLQGEAR